ncbi:hypothetical protein J19TS2_31280 [Cohnella xylanilytica]|nr:hypothetical protein J19TS2_31280 [Cohnella xylanilytica]
MLEQSLDAYAGGYDPERRPLRDRQWSWDPEEEDEDVDEDE